MEESVSRIHLGDRHLQDAYQRAVVLFSELRQGNLRSGEARTIASRVLSALGAEHMRRTIETALNLAAEAHATKSAAQAARRAWWLAALATIIAMIVAVPAVTQVLASAESESKRDDAVWPVETLAYLNSLGFGGPWILLGSVLVTALVVAGAWFVVTHVPHRLRDPRRGYAWPTVINVRSAPSEADDEADDDRPAPSA